mmetsp:Transcript_34808/g.62664  ORF Transcript_34808/g.62664 Transcript_34808/m.62664 type:complete len:86 (+) Transcript_34808:298-555(+)
MKRDTRNPVFFFFLVISTLVSSSSTEGVSDLDLFSKLTTVHDVLSQFFTLAAMFGSSSLSDASLMEHGGPAEEERRGDNSLFPAS